jgi:lipopolysaccharide export system permease protein
VPRSAPCSSPEKRPLSEINSSASRTPIPKPIRRGPLSWRASAFYPRSPAVLLLLLPYSLLLALLYALGKLSASREIIAMIQAGRSISRITLPLITAGVLFSLLGLGLNYHWAPAAEGNVDNILAEASGKQATEATHVLYRNAASRRLWMIRAFPQDYQKGEALQDVEVTTTREDKTLESRLCAKRAFWDRPSRRWTFEEAVSGNYPPHQAPVFETHAAPVTIDTWSETPWQLIKPGLSADLLGIPDLSSWLKAWSQNGQFADPSPYLTHWHYRWALPFACLVTVLLATPLGIHFSRRGPGGGIFLAVVLSALMMLFSSISLALGESGTLRPAHAAWLPNIVFSLLGLYLFHRRISGQPIYLILQLQNPGMSAPAAANAPPPNAPSSMAKPSSPPFSPIPNPAATSAATTAWKAGRPIRKPAASPSPSGAPPTPPSRTTTPPSPRKSSAPRKSSSGWWKRTRTTPRTPASSSP